MFCKQPVWRHNRWAKSCTKSLRVNLGRHSKRYTGVWALITLLLLASPELYPDAVALVRENETLFRLARHCVQKNRN